jgi:formylglycine-generating enzyme required for sulfatase activity
MLLAQSLLLVMVLSQGGEPAYQGPRMVKFDAGEFIMGCTPVTDRKCQADEQPVRKVTLAAFEIDQREVTVGEFAMCVGAGKCTKPLVKADNKHCNYGEPDRTDNPVNCVSWVQANEYCVFVGKRLPTEAEWERAARGTDGRDYPWGKEPPDCTRAVISTGKTAENPGEGCGQNATWPTCKKSGGNTPEGLCDMLGNVWEWVADWYAPDYYAGAPATNPAGPATGTERVLKGGAFTSEMAETFRASVRLHFAPETALGNFGFRCARSVP